MKKLLVILLAALLFTLTLSANGDMQIGEAFEGTSYTNLDELLEAINRLNKNTYNNMFSDDPYFLVPCDKADITEYILHTYPNKGSVEVKFTYNGITFGILRGNRYISPDAEWRDGIGFIIEADGNAHIYFESGSFTYLLYADRAFNFETALKYYNELSFTKCCVDSDSLDIAEPIEPCDTLCE